MSEKAERKRLYTLLQVGNTQLAKQLVGWTDEDYRALLARHGASAASGFSAKSMTVQELSTALKEMKDKGFIPKATVPANGKKLNEWRKPRIAKLNAMWCELADDGVVQDRSQFAMAAWCENQVPGLTKLQWASSENLNKAIEMMKGMKATHGVTHYERYR